MDQRWISVKVHPNAGKDVLVGLGPSRFEAWLKAKPIEGRANEALISLLARSLQIPPQRLRLETGASGRHTVYTILG